MMDNRAPSACRGNPSLRVALMCESDALGGAEMVIARLARELSRRGHQVVGVGPDEQTQPNRGSNGWLRDHFRQEDLGWRTYRKRRGVDPLCVKHLVDILREEAIDVVHSHEFAMAVYGTAATKLAGLPHVLTMHGSHAVAEKWKARSALRWAFASSRAAVAVSEATRTDLETSLRVTPGGLRVVHNGVPDQPGDRERGRLEARARAEELLVVAVGSLLALKNHELLIRSLAELNRQDAAAPWRLAIAGTGPERARLEQAAREFGVEDRVALLGARDDVPDLLAGADIFAMPSRWEGLPLALLEAMFSGTAIVATAVGGVPEAIEDGTQGLLISPNDSHQLTNALRRLGRDPALRASLGQAARQRAEQDFSIAAMTNAYERIYYD